MTRTRNHKVQIATQPDEIAIAFDGCPAELLHLVGQNVTGATVSLQAGVGGSIRLVIGHESLATHPASTTATSTAVALTPMV